MTVDWTSHPLSADASMTALAVELLCGATALAELRPVDAAVVVSYMRLLRCPEGGTLVGEGEDASEHAFMLLILDGEVVVQNFVPSRKEPVVATVLGPGSLIGETALIDASPRSATCMASTPVVGAGLSRNSFKSLSAARPVVALKLLGAVAQRMAQRLRENGRQQRVYHQLITAMQDEIDAMAKRENGGMRRQLQQALKGSPAAPKPKKT